MRALIAAAAFVVATISMTQAQDGWPERPVRIIVPGAPGGPSEVTIRTFGEPLSAKLGQQFIVELRPGAGGNIMAAAVAKAAPDGYTFGMTTAATHGIAATVYANSLTFDLMKDFAFVARFITIPNVLLVKSDSPFKTIAELIAFAKANPGKLNYGSLGPGTTTHLTGVSFALAAGLEIVHVPYKGSAPLTVALLSKEIDFGFDQIAGSIGQIKGGALRALAVTSKDRSSQLPNVPTISESGFPGFDFATWYGIMAPAATPVPVLDKFARELKLALSRPDIVERYRAMGSDASFLGRDEFRRFAEDEIRKWGTVVKASGLKVE